MNKIYLVYYLLKGWLLYKPFFKKVGFKYLIINPILITPRCISLGNRVFVRNNARIEGVFKYEGVVCCPEIIISDNVSIEQNLHLTCANKISIGKNSAIAANVTISDINHPYLDIKTPIEKQKIETKPVYIGEECKIYNNVVVLPGTIIGKHCVIGANSVVNKNIPDYCIAVGSPAKIIKRYCFEKQEWLKTDSVGNFIEY